MPWSRSGRCDIFGLFGQGTRFLAHLLAGQLEAFAGFFGLVVNGAGVSDEFIARILELRHGLPDRRREFLELLVDGFLNGLDLEQCLVGKKVDVRRLAFDRLRDFTHFIAGGVRGAFDVGHALAQIFAGCAQKTRGIVGARFKRMQAFVEDIADLLELRKIAGGGDVEPGFQRFEARIDRFRALQGFFTDRLHVLRRFDEALADLKDGIRRRIGLLTEQQDFIVERFIDLDELGEGFGREFGNFLAARRDFIAQRGNIVFRRAGNVVQVFRLDAEGLGNFLDALHAIRNLAGQRVFSVASSAR
jgi:hypothetical protein